MLSWKCAALAMLISVAATPVLAEGKLAFVVGIDAYPNLGPDAQLRRAVTDARSVGDALKGLGFTVTAVTEDASLDHISDAFDRFIRAVQPGDTVLFYYAGHGISLGDGNYLIPADVPALGPNDERAARRHSLAERDIKQDLHASGARVAVVVLDACRNNPFPARGTRAIGTATRGLARLDAAEGVYSLYSAREGQAALDRLSDTDPDRNSVFTRVFLKELETPGVSLNDLGEAVRDEVASLTRDAGTLQVPAVSNDLIGARSVFLAGPASKDTPPGSEEVFASRPPVEDGHARPPAGLDELTWSLIRDNDDPSQLKDFLARFPDSALRAQAEARLDAIKQRAAALETPGKVTAPPASSSVDFLRQVQQDADEAVMLADPDERYAALQALIERVDASTLLGDQAREDVLNELRNHSGQAVAEGERKRRSAMASLPVKTFGGSATGDDPIPKDWTFRVNDAARIADPDARYDQLQYLLDVAEQDDSLASVVKDRFLAYLRSQSAKAVAAGEVKRRTAAAARGVAGARP